MALWFDMSTFRFYIRPCRSGKNAALFRFRPRTGPPRTGFFLFHASHGISLQWEKRPLRKTASHARFMTSSASHNANTHPSFSSLPR